MEVKKEVKGEENDQTKSATAEPDNEIDEQLQIALSNRFQVFIITFKYLI